MKKFIFIAAVLICLCFVFTACDKSILPDDNIPEVSSSDEVHNSTYDFDEGERYIKNSIAFANDKIKEFSFENTEAQPVENTPYDRFECYFDNLGNVKSIGYDEEENIVFESYEISENGNRILYFEKTNGVISAMTRIIDLGRISFSFDNGVCTGYTLTENIMGMSSAEGSFKISYYNSDGYIKTEIFDEKGDKIS